MDGFCWNSTTCQTTGTEKCHIECLGCTKENSAKHCSACKNYEDNGTCVDHCPPDKVPGDSTIDSIGKLHALRGCTRIDGSLQIQLSTLDHNHLAIDLEEYLGTIKYIEGSLTIGRTNSLKSLSFLKNLTEIGGADDVEYSIFMYENQNLEKLWDFEDENFHLIIRKGTLRFHNNPLLCPAEIKRLANKTGILYSDLDVSPYSNGDKTACQTEHMEVTVNAFSTNASLEWKEPTVMQCNNYIGSTIYFKIQGKGIASYSDSKDVCIRNDWRSLFTTSNKIFLNKLQPDSSIDGDEIDPEFDDFDIQTEPANQSAKAKMANDDNCTCVPTTEFDDWTIQTVDDRYELCDIFAQSKFQRDDCKHFLYQPITKNSMKVQKRDDRNTSMCPYRSNQYYIPANETAYNITNLKHFTFYNFYFSACNLPREDHKCSPILMRSVRTKKKIDADDMDIVKAEVIDNTDAKLTWTEPKNPNSAIITYRIEYTNVDVEHAQPFKECIPRDDSINSTEFILRKLHAGRYKVKIQAESLAGLGQWSKVAFFSIGAPSADTHLVITTAILCVTMFISAIIFYVWYRRKHSMRHVIRDINPDYEGIVYVEDEWEIERNDIEILDNLGQGTFGTVFCGLIKSRNIKCAMKTINKTLSLYERMEFLNEASAMKSFSNCHHVIKLIGVVSKGQPPLVVMELMDRGDLKKFLRRTRDSSHNLTSNEIYRIAAEIADGMAYLAAKKFVHRDLAARNCMVAGDRTVKIGDFGMARDIYETDYYRKETKGLLPVRWMAPESLADGVFTSDSDVWSYGIVLWEIATLAEQPYQGLSNEQVLRFTISKGRLERPPECSDLLYEIMRQCWNWQPNDRPTFWDIVEHLESHVSQDFLLVSFIHSRELMSKGLISEIRLMFTTNPAYLLISRMDLLPLVFDVTVLPDCDI
ncbi:hypothetical protein JTB14_031503 [Gonioctena quinquepunctata]|nr:hypothetical protein JTB14_031503 [Gonioctena quinquepunctata]